VEKEGKKQVTIAPDSFRSWLRQIITQKLDKKVSLSPFVIWCDPEQVWKEILEKAAEDTFELWAEEEHELELRYRFHTAPRSPRVIYLPVDQENITYFKIFEIQAEEVIEVSLHDALASYGVYIQPEMLPKIKPLLPAHIKEWIDHPKKQWDELTVGNVKETLVDDEQILDTLAAKDTNFYRLIKEGKFSVFRRRVTEDFGLPSPKQTEPDSWRAKAFACLLCTEAAELTPNTPPTESEKIIPSGPARDRSLKMLKQWKINIELIDNFESLMDEADKIASLRFWANNLTNIPSPLSSKTAEKLLLRNEIKKLTKIEDLNELVTHLHNRLGVYKEHADGFWGKRAKNKIEWKHLVDVAEISFLLSENNQTEKTWKSTQDAIKWYTSTGWKIDQAGESLFKEAQNIPSGLIPIRTRLRRAYLRCVDHINSTFSELLEHTSIENLELDYAGNLIIPYIQDSEPTAFLFLDAFRYDLACRLAELINEGEPTKRAQIQTARAPIPSITALGMPYALPGAPTSLEVKLSNKKLNPWIVTSKKMPKDLTIAEYRREWLKNNYKIKKNAFLTISEIINPKNPKELSIKSLGKHVFIFGSEFDAKGHEGELQLTGATENLKRYSRTIRRLRDIGYSTIVVVTDHGFFQWQPEEDEIQKQPTGEILWKSRRAIVGENLKHQTALTLPVTGSNLKCVVPRSVNAFKTYGGLGFFHGGATLQELIIPIVIVHYPRRAKKIEVVLKPITEITSLTPRVEIATGTPVQLDLSGTLDTNLLSRNVLVKVIEPNTGKIIFKSKKENRIEPGGGITIVELYKLEGALTKFGEKLQILICDADNEEILDKTEVILKVELDEWD
jgi:hypothetical protein